MKQIQRSSGQAMVELVLMLFLIMGLCIGMLFSIRLLTFQFWAQQEARYIAFEQVWPSAAVGNPAQDPIEDLNDAGRFAVPLSSGGCRLIRLCAMIAVSPSFWRLSHHKNTSGGICLPGPMPAKLLRSCLPQAANLSGSAKPKIGSGSSLLLNRRMQVS